MPRNESKSHRIVSSNIKFLTSKATTIKPFKQERSSSTSQFLVIQCFQCQGVSHIASNYLNRKVVSLVEEIDEDLIKKDILADKNPIFNEDITYGEKGERLVIQRNLKTNHIE